MSRYRDQRRAERRAEEDSKREAEWQAVHERETKWRMYPLDHLIEHELDADPLLKHILLRIANGERIEDN